MTLLDQFLPRFDFHERHAITIDAPAGIVLDHAARQRAQDDPFIRTAIRLRELPTRLFGLSQRQPLDLDDFTFLGRDGDRGLAFGLTGAFWRPDYGLVEIRSPEQFRMHGRNDVCSLVMGFDTGSDAAGRTVLRTETRVFCPTAAVRRQFAPYWYLIRPVSGMIRRRMLARVRQQAESEVARRGRAG